MLYIPHRLDYVFVFTVLTPSPRLVAARALVVRLATAFDALIHSLMVSLLAFAIFPLMSSALPSNLHSAHILSITCEWGHIPPETAEWHLEHTRKAGKPRCPKGHPSRPWSETEERSDRSASSHIRLVGTYFSSLMVSPASLSGGSRFCSCWRSPG